MDRHILVILLATTIVSATSGNGVDFHSSYHSHQHPHHAQLGQGLQSAQGHGHYKTDYHTSYHTHAHPVHFGQLVQAVQPAYVLTSVHTFPQPAHGARLVQAATHRHIDGQYTIPVGHAVHPIPMQMRDPQHAFGFGY